VTHRTAVAAAALVLGALVTLVVAVWPSAPSAQAQQLARTGQACQQWAAGAQTPSSWCVSMSGWMRDQLADGAVTGPMMWESPSAMRDACRRWLVETGRSADVGRCEDMVAWMSGHAGDGNG
jgi:hypothetical protein